MTVRSPCRLHPNVGLVTGTRRYLIEGAPAAHAISDVERGDDAFVPFYLSMAPIFMIDANDSF